MFLGVLKSVRLLVFETPKNIQIGLGIVECQHKTWSYDDSGPPKLPNENVRYFFPTTVGIMMPSGSY